MNKDFKNFDEAMEYAKNMRSSGFKAHIEEFYNYDGIFYTVLVWEKA